MNSFRSKYVIELSRQSDLLKKKIDFFILCSLLLGLYGLVVIALFSNKGFYLAITFCLFLACSLLLCSVCVGFLFAISALSNPLRNHQVLQKPNTNIKDGENIFVPELSDNLFEIADWLTKIIIGIGLVNLNSIPNLLKTYSNYICENIGCTFFSNIFTLLIFFYFLLIGFIIGYLKTPSFLSTYYKAKEKNQNPDDNLQNTLDINSFISKYVVTENHYGEYSNTKTWYNIYHLTKDEAHTESILATIFWQIVLSSPSFIDSILLDTSQVIPPNYECIITSNGKSQYTLVVLVPAFSSITIVKSATEVIGSNSLDFFYYWKNKVSENSDGQFSAFYNAIQPEFVSEVISRNNLKILITNKPRMIKQNSSFPAIPVTAHGVCPQGFSSPNSTAGVYAESHDGQKGVVMCLHSLGDIDSAITAIREGHNRVVVDGCNGRIVSYDPISDSCFVVLDDQNFLDANKFLKVRGVLSGKTPRQYEIGSFDGFKSGPSNTPINGWSPDLPFVKRYNQLKVYTAPVTNPGDSGSALIDSDGYVCGFAFERSGIGESVQLSSWIWAESVFKFHNLKY